MNFQPEFEEIVFGFIQFAYNEMQTAGWKKRRYDFRKQFNLIDYEFGDYGDEADTFPEMLKIDDMDTILTTQFTRELGCIEWIDAYYYNLHPERLEYRIIDSCANYSDLGREFMYWLMTKPDNILLDKIKEILCMDICLK